MQPEDRDLAYLWDMQEAARDILSFVESIEFVHFSSNKMIRYAVERQLLVIGEASKGVSEAFKEAHPEIPWKSIVGQRNILAHDYGEILVERIWFAATQSIPELVKSLDSLIPPSDK